MKKNWRLIQVIRISSLDIETEFGMPIKKRQITEGIELTNQKRIKMFGEKETNKYLGILETDTIKQRKMKEYEKKYFR